MDSSNDSINAPALAALSLLDQGNTFLINGKPSAAITSYTDVIKALAGSNGDRESNNLSKGLEFRAYSHRSKAHLQLENAKDALSDAQCALDIVQSTNEISSILLDGELESCRSRKEKAAKLLPAATTTTAATNTATATATATTTATATATATETATATATILASQQNLKLQDQLSYIERPPMRCQLSHRSSIE